MAASTGSGSSAVGGPPPPREASARLPEGRLRRRVRGEGPAVLCLHGVSAHGGVWSAAAARLEGEFTLHVPDLLGRGTSDAPPDASYRLGREVARAAALAAELPDRGYLVAGHSQGAALAVALAAAAERSADGAPASAPGPCTGDADLPRPAGLALVAPVTPWTRRPPVLDLLRLAPLRPVLAPLAAAARTPLTRWVLEHRAFGDPGRVDRSTVRRYAAPWSHPRRAHALLRVLADWRPADLSRHLPRRLPPVEIVAGALDARIPPLEARRWAGRLGAGFTVAPDAGHVVPEERPDLVAAAVRRLADRSDRRR